MLLINAEINTEIIISPSQDIIAFETQLRQKIKDIGLLGCRIKWDTFPKDNTILLPISVVECTRYDFGRLVINLINFLNNHYGTLPKEEVNWNGEIIIGDQTIKEFSRKTKEEI